MCVVFDQPSRGEFAEGVGSFRKEIINILQWKIKYIYHLSIYVQSVIAAVLFKVLQ